MDWDIPRYWDADGVLRDSAIDGLPDARDIELGDSFLVHFTDANDVDHYYWVHGGIDMGQYDYDIDAAIDDVVEGLADRYGLET